MHLARHSAPYLIDSTLPRSMSQAPSSQGSLLLFVSSTSLGEIFIPTRADWVYVKYQYAFVASSHRLNKAQISSRRTSVYKFLCPTFSRVTSPGPWRTTHPRPPKVRRKSKSGLADSPTLPTMSLSSLRLPRP